MKSYGVAERARRRRASSYAPRYGDASIAATTLGGVAPWPHGVMAAVSPRVGLPAEVGAPGRTIVVSSLPTGSGSEVDTRSSRTVGRGV